MVLTWIAWNAIGVVRVGITSETTRTESPFFIKPFDFITSMAVEILASISSLKSTRSGVTPHCKFRDILVLSELVNANIGGFGRFRDNNDAMWPCFVYTKMASTARLLAAPKKKKKSTQFVTYRARQRKRMVQILLRHSNKRVWRKKAKVPISTAELHICSAMRSGNETPSWHCSRSRCWFSSRLHDSIRLLVICRTARAFGPCNPIADSPDSIKASAYCRTASEMSATCLKKANNKFPSPSQPN